MSEQPSQPDVGTLWRGQERERDQVVIAHLVQRRTEEWNASTRGETLAAIAAVLFLIAAVVWGLLSGSLGWTSVSLGLACAWVVVSIYWFRRRIWSGREPSLHGIAENCSVFYRSQMERRLRHLENAWLWHGPAVLACLVLAAVIFGRAAPSKGQLLRVLPLAGLFVIWLVFGFLNRRRQVKRLRRQIHDVDR